MTFGLAGGLDPKLLAGSVVLPSRLISRDGAQFATCEAWRGRVAAALRSSHAVTEGTLLTSAFALRSLDDKAKAFRDTGAAAVDMESVAVAVNGAVVRRAAWDSTPLADGDQVEVLTAVQGG